MQGCVQLTLALAAVFLLKCQGGQGAPKILMNRRIIPSQKQNPSDPDSQTVNYNNAISNHAKTERIGSCTEGAPKISILSYARDEFYPNETIKTELLDISWDDELVWMAPFAATVQIQCEARFPVQWKFDGPHEPEVLSIDVLREFDPWLEPTDSDSQNCFRVVMKLVTRKKSTGKYLCQEISDAGLSWRRTGAVSSLFLYAEVNGPPFLLYPGKEFTVTQSESSKSVTLPCQVVNPTVTPELYKGNSQVVSLDGSVPFDPQNGFTLDLQRIPSPFDLYKCSREGGSVFVNVKPLPAFRVTPPSPRLTVVEGNTLRLVCESVSPIGLRGFIDDSKVTIIKDENAPFYKNKLTYDYILEGEEAPTGISCVNLNTSEVLHTWRSTVIRKEIETRSGISYDPVTKSFYCFSKTSEPPVIVMAQCNGVMECQLTDKCFGWNAPFKLVNGGNTCFSDNMIQRGNTCNETDRNRLNPVTKVGCAHVSNSMGHAGMVHCSLPDNSEVIQLYYFNGLKSGTDVVISDWREGTREELIDIKILDQNRTFYAQELIEVKCVVSKFVFAQGQIFRFKLEDGSYSIPNEIVRGEEIIDDSLIIKISRLKLTDHRIKEVVCISPFWNQTGWMNNSVPITVIASIPPTIFESEESRNSLFVNTGINASLTCQADGLPLPKVLWYRNGKVADNQGEQDSLNGKSTIATLIINPVNPDDGGEYVCKAFNVAGTQTKGINFVVSESRRTFYTALVIGIITLTIFITIVMILWRKLVKNQAIIRRLTEKEEQEFRHGDLEALRNIPDGYIRAQYLPYDKQYEIKEENLEIDGEVLGKGEYGIVLKAILCLNDSRKEVAVKTSRSPDVNHFKALLTELKMLTYIGWHDNVINLLGAVTRNLRDRDVYVVIEYCRLGDLESFLRSNRQSFLNQVVNEKIDLNLTFNLDSQQAYQPIEYTMRTADLISWAYQISSGMEYLANKKVIHGDLASRNILLTEDRTVKITDFGLSKHLYNGANYISHSSMNLPWKHCAPEILQHNSFSTQSDVWAVGVTLWEVFSLGTVPYLGIPWTWEFKNKLLQGFRLDKPSHANQDIYNVILKCWKNTPAERLSFEELRKYFHRVLHHWAEEEDTTSSESIEEVKVPLRDDLSPTQQNFIENHYVVSPTNQNQQLRKVHYTAVA